MIPRSLQEIVQPLLRTLAVLLLCAFLGVGQAEAGSMTLLGVGGPAAGGAAPALDGSASGNVASATSIAVTLTTTTAGDRIVVFILNNDGIALNTVTDTAGLTYTRRAQSAVGNSMEEWSATSPGILTGDVITASTLGDSVFMTMVAFGVSGGTHAFDVNGALPSTSAASTVSITTTAASTLIYAGYRFSSSTATNGAGWTQIFGGSNFMMVEYQVVASTQSGTVATIGTGNGNETGGVGDAIH